MNISLTPAVFKLSDRVNAVATEYAKQPIVPRGPKMTAIFEEARHKLRQALELPKDFIPILVTSAGSGGIAVAVANTPAQSMLVISNGTYGERMAAFAKTGGHLQHHLKLPFGERPDLNQIEQLLKEHRPQIVGFVHGCTSTCNLNPINEIGQLCHSYGCRVIVDAISSSFVEELDVEHAAADLIISSSNKGLHAYPGLALIFVREDYLNFTVGSEDYWDLKKHFTAQQKGQHVFTINPRIVLELNGALDQFFAEGGLKGRIKMYQQRANLLRQGYQDLGLEIFKKPGMPLQNIGTALLKPEGMSLEKLAAALENPDQEESYSIYSVSDLSAGNLFRIFHMGDYPLEVYSRFLATLKDKIQKLSA